MGPRIASLPVDHHIIACDVVRAEDGVGRADGVYIGNPTGDEVGIDWSIDDSMRNAGILRRKFASHALRQHAQIRLCPCERRITAAAAQRRGCAREDDCSSLTRHHALCCFALDQDIGKAGHFPYVAADTCRRLGNREIDVDANVEHNDFERSDVTLNAFKHRDDVVLVASVTRKASRKKTAVTDRLGERLQLVGVRCAATCACGKPVACKRPRNSPAGWIACAHARYRSAHRFSPVCQLPVARNRLGFLYVRYIGTQTSPKRKGSR